MHDCDLKTQVCRNLLGTFVCIPLDHHCPSGFRLNDSIPSKHKAVINCIDIDECAEETFDCDTRQEDCLNYIGSYTCEPKLIRPKSIITTSSLSNNSDSDDPTKCSEGYHFVRFTYQCEDINECRIGQHNCNLSREKCVNFPGSFKCVPKTEKELLKLSENTKLTKMNLKMIKTCQDGYERNIEFDICEDIDECSEHINPCPSISRCQNILGSYVCHCKVS